jgi:scyllo-inositol 2-dehydrogenase (NADP+)
MTRTKTPIKVGIAGLGRSGWSMHANALAELTRHSDGAQFTIVAVCDPDATRQDEARQRFGCRTCADYTGLVGDDEIELMVIATPSQLHAGHTITALRAGKHVLVEKPMAGDLAEVDEMIAVAGKTGRILTVNQNYRYAADFQMIKGIIESGVMGRILQIRIAVHQFGRRWDWQTLKQCGGGILSNHGAHMVDWAMLLIDDPAPEVFCHMEATPLYAGDADSHVKLVLRPRGGPLIDIELTHACAYPQDRWLVTGTQGSLTSDRRSVHWKYFDPDEAPPLALDTQPTSDRSYNKEGLPWHEESRELVNDFGATMHQLYRDLYATIRQGKPPVITPESVRRQVAILQKCRQLNAA